jgi:orotidine-5'-phosphate decarboxylase
MADLIRPSVASQTSAPAASPGGPVPIVALDYGEAGAALAFVDRLGTRCAFYKVGLELFAASGPAIVGALRDRGADVFLDLKFHDIPNTVAGAVRSASRLGVRLVTVHAAGGRAMLEAAAGAAGPGCGVLAVTVLTSLDAAALAESWGRESVDVSAEVLRLAGSAAAAGLHGVVCSGHEADAIRARWGASVATLVPGIRPAGVGQQDQARVVTPRAAVAAGATYVVLGRAVTAAPDPAAAFEAIAAELRG